MDVVRSIVLFLASVNLISINSAPATLEQLTALECDSDRPFKCLPYVVCYNADEFCHVGTNESCFPKNVTTDQLENWCKTTGQFRPELMRDPKLCVLACQARFPSLNLSNAVDQLVNIKCPPNRPLKCLPDGICHGFDEYCHAGQNKSCLDVTMSDKELLQWCLDKGLNDVNLMPDPACKFACQAKFPSLPHEALNRLVNKTCPSERPFKCLPGGICHGFEQFCDTGQVKSCLDVTMSDNDLLQWCLDNGQNDVTSLPNPACKFACQTKFPNLLSTALDQLVNRTCPPDRQFKCLPSGICHSFDEYCHAGQNKSCFDGNMSEDELLQWCQHQGAKNVSLFLHSSCSLACHAKFLSVPLKENEETGYVFYAIIALIIIVAIAVVVVSSIFCRNLCCKKKPKPQDTSYKSGPKKAKGDDTAKAAVQLLKQAEENVENLRSDDGSSLVLSDTLSNVTIRSS